MCPLGTLRHIKPFWSESGAHNIVHVLADVVATKLGIILFLLRHLGIVIQFSILNILTL